MFRTTINAQTGEQKNIDLTAEELSQGGIRADEEVLEREAQEVAQLKLEAEDAEIRALVNVDTGTTPEAKEYQARKAKK